mmetsp:Transcript_17824/g.36222  ORF Transcript_17824/g.36222 Transcript_17824/m.36222 type:complete len:96 (-) Transcript_17824:241-528(-)
MGFPDYDERLAILKLHTAHMKLQGNVKLQDIAQRTRGLSVSRIRIRIVSTRMKYTKQTQHVQKNKEKIATAREKETENGTLGCERQILTIRQKVQ